MRGCGGGGRVILALLSLPRLRVKAILTALPHVVDRQIKDEISTEYIGNALQVISKTLAEIRGGSYIQKPLTDVLHPERQDNRSAEEIIADITDRAGLKVVNE